MDSIRAALYHDDMRAVDVTGRRFGRLTAERVTAVGGCRKWICRCDCGGRTHVRAAALRAGLTKSCGCLVAERRPADLTGQLFGRLTVISMMPKKRHGRHYFKCRCSCGRLANVDGSKLRLGHTKSCGCLVGGRRHHLPEGRANRNSVVAGYRAGAVRRGLVFDLSDAELDGLFAGPCFYCGAPPGNIAKRAKLLGAFIYSGIDRVNNDVGYLSDNVVSCCAECNLQKSSRNIEALLDWVERVAPNVNRIRQTIRRPMSPPIQ